MSKTGEGAGDNTPDTIHLVCTNVPCAKHGFHTLGRFLDPKATRNREFYGPLGINAHRKGKVRHAEVERKDLHRRRHLRGALFGPFSEVQGTAVAYMTNHTAPPVCLGIL